MNFLADESCARPVIRALRAASHDVISVAETMAGATDEDVLERALKERRILLTEDRDFGELTYARRRRSAGVVLIRFHNRARKAKVSSVVEAITMVGDRLANTFAVIEPGRIRISTRPGT